MTSILTPPHRLVPLPCTDLGIRPLDARSLVLSVLLGANPPRIRGERLVAVCELLGEPREHVVRAIEHLLHTGDLTLENGRYRLGRRLLPRQRRQDISRSDPRQPWNGRWTMAVVDPTAAATADGDEVSRALVELRFGPWRDGVWLRPDNLGPRRHPLLQQRCTVWNAAAPDDLDGRRLAAGLWDLDGWAGRAEHFLAMIPRAVRTDDRFRLATAVMVHLGRDPLLPDTLNPCNWPAAELRRHFAGFASELQAELSAFIRGG